MSYEPRPCSVCGEPIVVSYGRLDAAAFYRGVVQKHICKEPELPLLNERYYLEHLAPKEEVKPTPAPARKPVQQPAKKEPKGTTQAFDR